MRLLFGSFWLLFLKNASSRAPCPHTSTNRPECLQQTSQSVVEAQSIRGDCTQSDEGSCMKLPAMLAMLHHFSMLRCWFGKNSNDSVLGSNCESPTCHHHKSAILQCHGFSMSMDTIEHAFLIFLMSFKCRLICFCGFHCFRFFSGHSLCFWQVCEAAWALLWVRLMMLEYVSWCLSMFTVSCNM